MAALRLEVSDSVLPPRGPGKRGSTVLGMLGSGHAKSCESDGCQEHIDEAKCANGKTQNGDEVSGIPRMVMRQMAMRQGMPTATRKWR